MCETSVSKYINAKCAAFLIAVLFSAGIFVVAVLGLLGVYNFDGSFCYATGLLSSVLTLWCSPPRLEANKEKKTKPNDNSNDIL